MLRALRLAHILGLVMSLGSIATFIVVSATIDGGGVESIAVGRRIISTGTNTLTIPGLCLLAFGGIWMGQLRYGFKHRFFQLKITLLALICANGAILVAPSVHAATEIATRSLAHGKLLAEYGTAYARESIAGSVNVVLIVAAAVAGVWKAGAADAQRRAGTRSSVAHL